MIRVLIPFALAMAASCGVAMPQTYEYSPPHNSHPSYTFDPAEATIRFAILFKETCFEYRHSLQKLRTFAALRGWRESLGPFPYRHDGYITNISWDILLAGSPTQLQLITFDNVAPDYTCVLISYAMDTSLLSVDILDKTPLFFHRRMPIGSVDATLFVDKHEIGIRVICYPSPDIWLIGQCGLTNRTTEDNEQRDQP